MTHRERVLAVLRGETPDIIPLLRESPMDATCLSGILPKPKGDPVIDGISDAEFYDNSSIVVEVGPRVETLSRSRECHIYKYETGAVWQEYFTPTYYRRAIKFPIEKIDDIDKYHMPDPFNPDLYKGIKEKVVAWKKAGYFIQGYTMGIWQGIYYQLTSFENIMIYMATEPDAAARLFKMMGDYALGISHCLLETGVDAVFTASDFGSSHGLLFSPEMFYQYIFPWLKELADLCHSYGAILHLHSHGHIENIMDGIVLSGVDLFNPVGPSDYNDLGYFKKKWGDKITLMGGISTKIAEMNLLEMEEHIAEVMRIGCAGGKFIPRTESGIPLMPAEKILAYLDILKKYRLLYSNQ